LKSVTLGKTGLQVAPVGFGGIPIQRLSEQKAIDVVSHCLDKGVTFVDTANGYSVSEERIGKAIAGRRDGLVLATKSHGGTAEAFRQEMELSFKRLQVEHIDIYQFHGVSKPEQFEQIIAPGGPLDVAREAKAAGRIGHIGVTSHSLDVALKLAASGLFETLMFPFNFITREPAEELLGVCRDNGVAFISMKPMGGGLLEDAALAFKWLRQYPDAYPLVGIQSYAEIDEIVGVMEGPAALTADEAARIAALRAELGTRFCRSCEYCQPCPQGIRISWILRLKSHAKRMPATRVFGESSLASIQTAETCADCGVCEERCPYELPIREMTAELIDWFYEQRAAWLPAGS